MTQISNVALVNNGKILLGRRSDHRAAYPNCWALPGGHVEPGETPEHAARREASEELGIAIADLVPLDPFKVSDLEGAQTTYHVFVAASWDGVEPLMHGDEHSELRWFDVDEACHLTGLAFEEYRTLFQSIEIA